MNTPSDLGERIADLHRASGFSARRLSELAGLSQSMIGQLERGQVRDLATAKARDLADLFGVSLDWLVAGEGDRPTDEHVRATVARRDAAAPKDAPAPKVA